MTGTHKLYRSRTDRMISGVCGGLGEYFGVDSTFVRILFVVLAAMGGGGLLIYIVLAIVIPEKGTGGRADLGSEGGEQYQQTFREGAQEFGERVREIGQNVREGGRGAQFFGWALLAVGVWFLLTNLGFLRVNEDVVWPLLLIGLGVWLVLRNRGGQS